MMKAMLSQPCQQKKVIYAINYNDVTTFNIVQI